MMIGEGGGGDGIGCRGAEMRGGGMGGKKGGA